MKKILITIGLILICYLGYGQYPITQNLGGPTTLVKNPNYGAVQGGLIPFTFADTTAASAALTYGKNYNGFLIWTTTPPAIWYRAYTLNKWVQLIPGADTTSVAAWSTRLNTNIPTDASLNGFFGTTAANGIGFWTNNTQRIILPAAGLTFNQVVSDTTANKVMTFNPSTKEWGYGYWFGGGGAATTPISSLTAAAASNTISNANYSQQWQWALTSGGGGLQLVNTSSTSSGNEKVFEISTNGVHGSNNITTYGGYITNSHSGTGSINVALNARALNGDENIAAWFGRGKVRLGTTSFEKGVLEILGNTSGTVTIQPAAAAGTWTMTLPTTDGNSGEYLQTDGNGVTSWAAVTAGANTALSNLASVAINTSLLPGTDDGAALGSTSKQFSDLFLASGGIINWNNGNTTLTQTSGALTLGGSFYSTGSVAAATMIYGGDKYNTYSGYTGAVFGGISTHGVLDFVDNNNRIGEFYTDASNFNFFTDAGKGIIFYVNNSFTAPAMQFSSAGALRLGYLGAGALTADASGNITSVSDLRLKNVQGQYEIGLNQVMKINPIVYKWKPETKLDSINNYIGFAAQNIEAALGENAIGVNHDGHKSIQDRAILAAAINSIKQLKELNDKQQAEIDNLKKEVRKLKNN